MRVMEDTTMMTGITGKIGRGADESAGRRGGQAVMQRPSLLWTILSNFKLCTRSSTVFRSRYAGTVCRCNSPCRLGRRVERQRRSMHS